jgi:putative SOS response-associated peptidase YedK
VAQPDVKRVESFTSSQLNLTLLIEPINNRMPDEEPWLDASRRPFAKAKSVLKPYPEELMDAHDVSPIVNSARYDGGSAFNRFQMNTHLAPASYPCCDDA